MSLKCGEEKKREPLTVDEPTKKIDVKEGPVTITVKQETLVMAQGKNVAEKCFTLTPGNYVVGEVKKTLYIKNQGRLEKHGMVDMIIAERTL